MAQNRQLQKIAPPKIRRIRHRRRSTNVANARFAGRHPALANFLSREATRYNALGGVVGVTSAEIIASVQGVGTSTLNRNTGDTFDVQVDAISLRAVAAAADLDDKGIPIL